MSMTLSRRLIRILLILLLLPPILAGVAGWLVAPNFLRPIRRELTPTSFAKPTPHLLTAAATGKTSTSTPPTTFFSAAGSSAPTVPTATGFSSSTE